MKRFNSQIREHRGRPSEVSRFSSMADLYLRFERIEIRLRDEAPAINGLPISR